MILYVTAIDLPNAFIKCPLYWRNFIRSLGEIGSGITIEEINAALREYAAYYEPMADGGGLLRFNSDSYHTSFILRWS